VGTTPVEVLFAPHRPSDPNNGLNLIGSTLAAAQQQLDLALFVFSAQDLTTVIAGLQTGDFQERCRRLAPIQAARLKSKLSSAVVSSVG